MSLSALASDAQNTYKLLVGDDHANVSAQYGMGDDGLDELLCLGSPVELWGEPVRYLVLTRTRPAVAIEPHPELRAKGQSFAVVEYRPIIGAQDHSPAMWRDASKCDLVFHGVFRRQRRADPATRIRGSPDRFVPPETNPSYLRLWDDPALRRLAVAYKMILQQGREGNAAVIRHDDQVFLRKSPRDCGILFLRSFPQPELKEWFVRERKVDAANRLIPDVDDDGDDGDNGGGDDDGGAGGRGESKRGAAGRAASGPAETKEAPPKRPRTAAAAAGRPAAATNHSRAVRTWSTPTTYKGVKYASRLEAKWSFVFHRLGLRASYEPVQITSPAFDVLLAAEPGRGSRRYYKPDFVLPDLDPATAVEVKPNAATRHERLLCAEYARAHGPILLLAGGGSRGQAGGFAYPVFDKRILSRDGVPQVPTGTRFVADASRPSGVRAETVYLGRNAARQWTFLNICDVDAGLTAADRDFLRQVHADAENHDFRAI